MATMKHETIKLLQNVKLCSGEFTLHSAEVAEVAEVAASQRFWCAHLPASASIADVWASLEAVQPSSAKCLAEMAIEPFERSPWP
jgi:hypothetical protein